MASVARYGERGAGLRVGNIDPLTGAVEDEIDDALENFGWTIDLFECSACGAMGFDGFFASLFDSVQRRVRRFA